jgi:hypothetical protein
MSRTIEEIREYLLTHYDVEDIIEIYNISSEELLDRFEDKVLYYWYKVEEEIEENDEELT